MHHKKKRKKKSIPIIKNKQYCVHHPEIEPFDPREHGINPDRRSEVNNIKSQTYHIELNEIEEELLNVFLPFILGFCFFFLSSSSFVFRETRTLMYYIPLKPPYTPQKKEELSQQEKEPIKANYL